MDVGIATGGFSDPTGIAQTVRSVFPEPVTEPADQLDPAARDLVVVSGWVDIRTMLEAGDAAPFLVVDAPPGLPNVDRDELGTALTAVADGAGVRAEHVALTARSNGDRHPVTGEALFMTTEPASISEYEVRQGGDVIDRYRADGVVLASPPSSAEYPRAADGPLVDPRLVAIVVVPIAPYRIDPDRWVLGDGVDVEVMRDEGEVGLFLDGTLTRTVGCGDVTAFEPGPRYETVSVPRLPSR